MPLLALGEETIALYIVVHQGVFFSSKNNFECTAMLPSFRHVPRLSTSRSLGEQKIKYKYTSSHHWNREADLPSITGHLLGFACAGSNPAECDNPCTRARAVKGTD